MTALRLLPAQGWTQRQTGGNQENLSAAVFVAVLASRLTLFKEMQRQTECAKNQHPYRKERSWMKASE